jgi:hypothetical protein
MLETLRNLAGAVAGMFAILSAWVWLQGVVRRRSGCHNPEKDVLEFMLHGCGGGCKGKGSCHSETTVEMRGAK